MPWVTEALAVATSCDASCVYLDVLSIMSSGDERIQQELKWDEQDKWGEWDECNIKGDLDHSHVHTNSTLTYIDVFCSRINYSHSPMSAAMVHYCLGGMLSWLALAHLPILWEPLGVGS